MYTNEENLSDEIPDEVLNNSVNKENNKSKNKKKIIKKLLIISIVIFSLIPLIIDIIEFIQRIQKNYETRIPLVAQIIAYILLIPFAIYLYKHGKEEPASDFNCFICIGTLAFTTMFCTMMEIYFIPSIQMV